MSKEKNEIINLQENGLRLYNLKQSTQTQKEKKMGALPQM